MTEQDWKNPEPPVHGACGNQALFVLSNTSTGRNIVAFCQSCWLPVFDGGKPFYPRAQFDEATYAAMPMLPDANQARCPRCKKLAHLETHHYAPRSKFGSECDDWPTEDLCRPCHAKWHRLMGMPIGEPVGRLTTEADRRVLQPVGASPIEQLIARGEKQ